MPTLSLQFLDPLSAKIQATNLDSLARDSGFLTRRSPKITPSNFLLTCCLFALQNYCSLASLAQLWALLHKQTLSKQAVQKRFRAPAVDFLQAVLQNLLQALVSPKSIDCPLQGLFNRILIQDSTCLEPSSKTRLALSRASQSSRVQTSRIKNSSHPRSIKKQVGELSIESIYHQRFKCFASDPRHFTNRRSGHSRSRVFCLRCFQKNRPERRLFPKPLPPRSHLLLPSIRSQIRLVIPA